MTPTEITSAVSLSIVALLAGWSVFSRHYRENWAQFAGLVGIAIWAVARVLHLADLTEASIPGRGVLMHTSLALYGIGTAWKVWRHRPPRPSAYPPAPPTGPGEIDPSHLRHVLGGSNQ